MGMLKISFVACAAAIFLPGCAPVLQPTPPHYDYSEQVVIAPGFPVESVAKPNGYRFVGVEDLSRQEGYASALDFKAQRQRAYQLLGLN